MLDKCTACGVPYTDHMGLIGMCNRLQEAIKTVGELEFRFADLSERYECKSDAHNAALLTIDAHQKQVDKYREALERIANPYERKWYKSANDGDDVVDSMIIIATEALQMAGGDNE